MMNEWPTDSNRCFLAILCHNAYIRSSSKNIFVRLFQLFDQEDTASSGFRPTHYTFLLLLLPVLSFFLHIFFNKLGESLACSNFCPSSSYLYYFHAPDPLPRSIFLELLRLVRSTRSFSFSKLMSHGTFTTLILSSRRFQDVEQRLGKTMLRADSTNGKKAFTSQKQRGLLIRIVQVSFANLWDFSSSVAQRDSPQSTLTHRKRNALIELN